MKSVGVAVLALDRPDIRLIFLERINVHHPVEDHGMKCSTGGVAGFLRDDRSPQTKLRMCRQHFFPLVRGRSTEVHVLVPLRNPEWNALVELLFRQTLGRGIHHADQLVVVALLCIEQGRGVLGIETEKKLSERNPGS